MSSVPKWLIALLLLALGFIIGASIYLVTSRSAGPPEALLGKSQSEVLQKYGEPQARDEFGMSGAIGEFRIELQNTYPLTDPVNAAVKIQEWTWNRGDDRVTIWFHQVEDEWRAFHTKTWHKDMEF